MKNKLLMIIFSLFLVFCFIIECNDKTIFSVDSIRYLEEQSLSDKNDALLSKVDRLEKLAEAYIMERDIPASKVELCMQYIRKDRYSTEKWIGLLGPIDADFIEYVEKEDGALTFTDSEVLYDLKNSRPIDFVHMIATLNSYVRYGDNIPLIIMPISTHYAGWAGDLLTFLEEVTNYRINNNIEDANVYQSYVDSLLGTNKISTMSSPDVLADFDAYDISHDATLNVKNGLYSALNRYYKTFDSYSSVGNRFEVIKSLFGSSESVISGFIDPYLTQLTIRKLFIPDTTDKVTDLDLQVIKSSFSKYIDIISDLADQDFVRFGSGCCSCTGRKDPDSWVPVLVAVRAGAVAASSDVRDRQRNQVFRLPLPVLLCRAQDGRQSMLLR